MKLGALVAVAILTSAQGFEIGSGFGNNVVEKVKVDASRLACSSHVLAILISPIAVVVA